jgi:hypothetical protein
VRIRKIILGTAMVTAGSAAAATAAYMLAVRPWWRSWGVDPSEADLPLAGDDLVPDALVSETRSIDIAAPPEAVWPWLVQMGYNRAGWYSYDAMDMRGASADRIVPEMQALAVGDSIPTSPETAFLVKVLDPGRALVLYVDEQLIQDQTAAARTAAVAGQPTEKTPANLRAAGAMMSPMSGFVASWAFVLQARDGGGHTRLIERFRVKMAPVGKGGNVAQSFLGFGVFVMARKQLIGIRDRVERSMSQATEIVPGAAAEVVPGTDTEVVLGAAAEL